MRTLLTIISTFMFLNSNGQTNVSFVFYDACNESVIELPYFVNDFESDTTIRVAAGQSISLTPNYYQVEVVMIWNEMITNFWFDLEIDEQLRTDTLYLQKARFYGPTYLHAPPEEFKHYCCGELCNGKVEELDSNSLTRFKGRFRNGRPTSNLKYYNSSGELTRTEVYENGQLERIK
mgnify:CR=1 FL=1